MADSTVPIPRGRHAPPLEVRLERQRERLFAAAARVFARSGYAEASAEAISREAGMSKATFYEHFTNKEDAIIALFDAAAEQVRAAVAEGFGREASATGRVHEGVRGFLMTLITFPDHARTLLVEIIGAGPRAMQRRDEALQEFADFLDRENAMAHERFGVPRFRSPDDGYAIVGAAVELASRQLRHGRPADPMELEPVIERLIEGVLRTSAE
jgi:AcrR family transcriptional regulator